MTTALNTSKTLQSVTLPTTTSPGSVHVFAVGVSGPAYNNIGITDNSNPGVGNFDGSSNGNSYSAQTLSGVDLVANQQFDLDGIAYCWPDESSGTADNYQASGQVLPVTPVPGATMLGLLGAATNGNTSGMATLTYTDGTTTTFTLGFTDWASTTPAYGNAIAATCTSYNTPGGNHSGTRLLFIAEQPLQASKTLQSVTLPTTVTGGQLHVFAVGTRAAFNNLGTSNDSQPGEGSYDNEGKSWSIQTLESAGIQQGQPFIFNGISFPWPASYGTLADNYIAAGQTIPVTPVPNATTLGFLGSGTSGSPTGTATITYTDQSTSTFTLGMTDWWSATPQIGGTLDVFMVGTRTGENYPNNVGTSDDSDTVFANLDTIGRSYSIEALEAATPTGLYEGQPFTFNGVTFTWPASYSVIPDNYQAAGQLLPVTPVTGATTLAFLGTATSSGSSHYTSGTATITYTDGSTQTFPLALTDWWNTTPLQGNQIAATCSYINTATGQLTQTVHVYYTDVALQTGKTIQSVTLPSSVSTGALHIFAVATK